MASSFQYECLYQSKWNVTSLGGTTVQRQSTSVHNVVSNLTSRLHIHMVVCMGVCVWAHVWECADPQAKWVFQKFPSTGWLYTALQVASSPKLTALAYIPRLVANTYGFCVVSHSRIFIAGLDVFIEL